MARARLCVIAAILAGLLLGACSSSGPVGPADVPANEPPRADPPPGQGGEAPPNDEPYPDVFFENPGVNPFIDTEDDALSTFALDVDTGSYTVARRFLTDGNLPDRDSVRVEEYVNAFPTGYSPPASDPFEIRVDGGPTPFVMNERYQVARIAIGSRGLPDDVRPPLALTFVIDVSGSMAMESRLELVKDALLMLVTQMAPADTLAIAVYGSEARVVLEPTAIGESESVRDAITGLFPEGSTNAEAGLLVGYELARRGFREGGVNRVILASDGVANVGNTGADAILERIRDEARAGIQLTTLGFGMGNYNDTLMEQLANDGDGTYAYIDTIDEAQRLFVDELNATLVTVALDAKVQVAWDPASVERYRLIGFENRNVADEDFRDDAVEAGAIGAGHTVTALYELRLTDVPGESLGTVHLRWTDPDGGEPLEMTRDLRPSDLAGSFEATDRHFRLAATVAAFAEVLRESTWVEGISLGAVAAEAGLRAAEFPDDASVRELADLVTRAASLEDGG